MQNDQGCYGLSRRQGLPRSQCNDRTITAYGSVDTAILRFGTPGTLTGTAISRNFPGGTAANGSVWIINEDGNYSISVFLREANGGREFGILRNGSGAQLTTNASNFSPTDNNGYVSFATSVASSPVSMCWTGFLAVGDTIRIGADTTMSTFSTSGITITKVS